LNSRVAIWTAGIFVVGIALIAMSKAGALGPLENAVLTVISPVEKGLRNASDPVAEWLTNLGELNDLSSENKELRAENERLKGEVTRLRENESRLQELEKLLQVEQAYPDQEFLAASVLAKDPSNLKEVIAIDRGKGDGVREGMVVVTEGHSLVGTVTTVLDAYSWVTLITDPNSAVSAMVQESRAQGVVTGSYSRQLSIEFVAQGAAVKEGDVVITSAIGGHYPPGLVMGRVTAVQSTPQELFKKVAVEPLASLARLETVLVLTSFVPLNLEAP
jgi:rod shape-determining protein MreC